ncbi:hypothetical protein MRX96_004066 [Rhipicephalus microplus]
MTHQVQYVLVVLGSRKTTRFAEVDSDDLRHALVVLHVAADLRAVVVLDGDHVTSAIDGGASLMDWKRDLVACLEDLVDSADVEAVAIGDHDYLRLAPCFKSLFVEGGKCSQKYKSMIQWSKASTDITEAANVEEGLRRTCCTFNEYVHCYYVHMPELCGEEGRDFFRTYTEKMSGPLIHEHCASYTFDSTCSCQAMAAPCRWAAAAAAAYLLFIAAAMLV